MFTAILQIAATVLANLINSRKCSNERADSLNVGVFAHIWGILAIFPLCSATSDKVGTPARNAEVDTKLWRS